MEELNLPPGMIAFVRKNARNLQIGLISVVILVLGWVFYDYYTETQEKKGASLLASGLQTESPEQRVQILESVISDYGRTDAGRWSKLELAHIDYNEGRYEAAAVKYKETLDALPATSSLAPITRLNLAQSYEQAEQYDQAIIQYNFLKKSAGFAEHAHVGLGRIYIAKEDPVQARKIYEEFLNGLDETADPLLKSRIEAKLSLLDADKAVISSQQEETRE